MHLPEGYAGSTRTYPVHYVLDGEFLFRLVAANVELLAENRIADMLMPETIVIGIVNVVRDTDYTPTRGTESESSTFPRSGGGKRFLRFLADELIPLVDASFRTNGYRLLTGWSFSGLFTVYALAERPELFNAYHAISGSLWWDEDLVIEALLGQSFERPTKLFTSVGSIEVGGKTFAANKRLAESLTTKPLANLELTHIEIPDVGHHLGVAQSIDRALRTLYSDYLAPEEVRKAGLASVMGYYERLSESYGYEVPIPYRVYEALGVSFWREDKDKPRAVDLFQDCVGAYPGYPMAHLLLGLSYQSIQRYRPAADSIARALEIERRRTLSDASNLLLFQERLDRVEEQLGEEV
ncbi:MAG: hypothetical protein MI919_13575, partial [Holophagales bacterium]|nr:hypothetical protein [Holophagales bacterium]